jgi:hypothetical protein
MRARIQEDNSTRAYHRSTEGMFIIVLYTPLTLLQRLGFDSFTTEVEDVLKDHKQQQKVREVHTDTRRMMNFVSGPREEGRQDKGFGYDARRTYGKARRTFRCKSRKIRSTAGTATAIGGNLSCDADSEHSGYLRFVLLLYRTPYISTSNDFYFLFLCPVAAAEPQGVYVESLDSILPLHWNPL